MTNLTMIALIIVSVVVVGGLVYLGFAIKNAPVIDEPDESSPKGSN